MKNPDANPTVVARHALAWLVFGNAIGVGLALLLLLPNLNSLLGEWTYGRWMMVHMNVLLYGWCGIPMLGFLFHTYGLETGRMSRWTRPIVWLWSLALMIGSASWLQGHSSGKLFLDWTGFARIFFVLTLETLWIFLVAAVFFELRDGTSSSLRKALPQLAGIVVLGFVPNAIYFATNPGLYPAINPNSGGPTGASQLESTLSIVLILLVIPFGITSRNPRQSRIAGFAWIMFAAQAIFCAFLGRADASNHLPLQYLGLTTSLVWVPLIPLYYNTFRWREESRRWRSAFLWWWGGLVITGCAFFFPGILDRFKFTDGLVGHSLTAVAGFLTAFLIFIMVELAGPQHAWIFNRTWSFHAWNMGVLAYVLLMTATGWIESADPAFTISPGGLRDVLYFLRLLTGVAMLAASIEWLRNAMTQNADRIEVESLVGAKAA
ncbi:MAG: hypothetical protein KGN79_03665 [Acidobacteriota bacterium]|nr:hypothetical protein [Acidobacteriota bacterium]